MEKKIILITGASDGIGKYTATALAKEGHKLIIHGRNREKTLAAAEEIKRTSGNTDVDVYLADFLSLGEVRKFAEQIRQKYDHLDVLINNAGAQFTDKREATTEGNEKTMTINVFAPMLLTLLLLDLLKKSKSARVVTVASDAHRMVSKLDLDDIQFARRYSMASAYGISKLYIIWIMQYFVKNMKATGINNVAFITVHPASTRSSLGREAEKSLKWKFIYFVWRLMMVPIETAASSSIKAATDPAMENATGRYFGPKGEETPSQKFYSPGNEQKIWDYAMKVIQPYI